MSILFSDGLESGDYTNFASTTVTGAGASLAANAAAAITGSFGSDAKVNGAGGDQASCLSASNVPSTNIISVQANFKLHSNNVGTGEVYLFGTRNASGSKAVYLENNGGTWNLIYTNRAVSVVRAALTQQTFTLDQTYNIELNVDWSGANQVYKFYIGGSLDTTSTDSSSGSNIVYSTVWGGIYAANATTGVVETYLDDFKLADAYIGTTPTLSGGPTLTGVSLAGNLAETYVLRGGPTLGSVSLAGTVAETYVLSGGPTLSRVAVAGAMVADPPRFTSRSLTAGVPLGVQGAPAGVALGTVSKPAPVPLV